MAKLIFASTFRHQLPPLVQNCLLENFDNMYVDKLIYVTYDTVKSYYKMIS